MDAHELLQRIAAALGVGVVRAETLSGGQVGQALRCRLDDGRDVVAKTSPGTPLGVEAYMLRYLKERSSLPVPDVLHAEDDLLVQEFVEGSSVVSEAAEREAGRLLAELHGVGAERFGLERDTLIGPFPLDNRWMASWPEFYAERRLLPMAEEAHARGRLSSEDRGRVERLAAALPELFDTDPVPSLIHGDVWGGNVLARGDRMTAFLDPAIYYAHAEMELSFIDLFHTFGSAFYQAYEARRPIEPGYGRRRDLYQVFPLLVHVALFGGSYVAGLRARLDKLGV
ncbi:MAG: fructosamine kinase family protein [Deinococcales bacterium]